MQGPEIHDSSLMGSEKQSTAQSIVIITRSLFGTDGCFCIPDM